MRGGLDTQRHKLLGAAVTAVLFLCAAAALAGPREGRGGRNEEYVAPGAMPRERARIMGLGGPDDPRAAAEARRNLGGNEADNDVKAKKELRRKEKEARRR